jgi:hypothetical protein
MYFWSDFFSQVLARKAHCEAVVVHPLQVADPDDDLRQLAGVEEAADRDVL